LLHIPTKIKVMMSLWVAKKMRGSNCCYEILLKKMPIAESVRKIWKMMW
jgi:hypothetical protein